MQSANECTCIHTCKLHVEPLGSPWELGLIGWRSLYTCIHVPLLTYMYTQSGYVCLSCIAVFSIHTCNYHNVSEGLVQTHCTCTLIHMHVHVHVCVMFVVVYVHM